MRTITKFFALALAIVMISIVLYFSYIFIRGFLWSYGIVKLPPALVNPQIAIADDNYYLIFSTTSSYYPPYVWLSTSKDGVHWSPPSFIYQCESPQLSLNDKLRPLIACSIPYESVITLSLGEDSNWSRVEIIILGGSLYPFTDSLIRDEKGVFWLALEDHNSSLIYSSQDGVDWVKESVILPPEESIFGWRPRFVVNGSNLLLVLQGDPYSWVYRKTESGWIKDMRFGSTENPYPARYVKDSKGMYWTPYGDDTAIYVKHTKDLVQWSEPTQIVNKKVMEKLLASISKEE